MNFSIPDLTFDQQAHLAEEAFQSFRTARYFAEPDLVESLFKNVVRETVCPFLIYLELGGNYFNLGISQILSRGIPHVSRSLIDPRYC